MERPSKAKGLDETMWESVLKKDQFEIRMNPTYKSILFQVSDSAGSEGRPALVLNQAELFELLHAFLAINRSFNQETMYYEEGPDGA
ncbi:hypothetical protein [Paenibacillus tyrfis]|uniref:Uncharacterized protein n=1 Tax=Paenibacillus tyrfis TaxID=1501230 RepID=A0A081P5P9_9BACL|nr:hypothetical protein [Paenibacillus tyrfis]KEQ26022.1 hypothetical protein ET33_36165 [Paenibacillus tyrfis]